MRFIFLLASAIRPTFTEGETFGLPVKPGGGFIWVLGNIANAMLAVVATAAVVFLIIGGFQYVLAVSEESTQKAKKTIQWAVRGLLLAILSWTIVNIATVGSPFATT